MPTAITRRPSPSLSECELTFIERRHIDFETASRQHRSYEEVLAAEGLRVISMPAEVDLPDSVFVEDTAVVFDECAVICSTGVETRMKEAASIEAVLRQHREVFHIKPPGLIEGGDVLTNNKTVFAGISTRTNESGFHLLKRLLEPFGYSAVPVELASALHLKTACTFLDDETVLLNPRWIDRAIFSAFEVLEVAENEPFAGNVLKIGDSILMHSGFEGTIEKLREADFNVDTIDISEFQKAEAGLTCLSLIFE